MIELPILDPGSGQEERPRQKFWRSYSQLEQHPDFEQVAQHEFMPGATDPPSGATRRQFLQLMGASMAMAGLTACRRPAENILPYTRKPEEIIPGIPLYYATAMPFRGVARGLLVESHEGRPTKVEGNPEHPVMLGRTSLFEQASIMRLYDPDRSRSVLREGEPAAPADFARFMEEFTAGDANRRVVVLSEESSSLTLQRVRERLRERYPRLDWISYAPEGDDPVTQATLAAYGRPLRPFYQFDGAEAIVSLDADFLGPTNRNFVHNTRSFAQSRRLEGPEDDMSRLYVVESAYSVTGSQADNRLPLRASDIPLFAAALAARLGVDTGDVVETVGSAFADHPWVVEVAEDLRRAGPNGIVLAGETQPPAVHALALAINSAIGSIGQAVELLDTNEEPTLSLGEALPRLVEEMRAGQVDALFMVGANPVYEAPAALDFAAAMEQVPVTVHLGLYVDETAQLSDWHLPRVHYLEAWGDGRAYDGTYTVMQPLIAPLYDPAVSEIELLQLVATGIDTTGYDLVRETWRDTLTGPFEQEWRRLLHDGFLPATRYPAADVGAPSLDLGSLLVVDPEEVEVVFRLDPTILDGSFANVAYLQELPDPTTKIVWDNVALMSRRTAERFGLSVDYDAGQHYADIVAIEANGGVLEIPVWVMPGHPDNSITLNFGYGRNIRSFRPEREASFFDKDAYTDIYGEGALATGVGVNVFPLRSPLMERVLIGAEVAKAGEGYMLATTQEHGSLEGRPLFRMATLEEYRENPDFAEDFLEEMPEAGPWIEFGAGEEHPVEAPGDEPRSEFPTLWQDDHPSDQPAYKDDLFFKNQWAMVIDLNACTGCNSCVTACDLENNIPMVGKEEVARGREMHWLRIDRYFTNPTLLPGPEEGDVDEEEGIFDPETYTNPQMVMQPIPCMHCENAPCEPVCPVAATSHSSDGINEMTYNRCIGTRYCSNNCPYKVRRFNFFNWTKTMPAEVQMAMNPNVTVRFRGVMEKCTYCVQRVREVNRRAIVEDRRIYDGEVLTACQQVCPADAIVFGDINDPDSKVSRYRRNNRRYEMLAELNVKPRTSYLGQVRNPNTRLTPGVLEAEGE